MNLNQAPKPTERVGIGKRISNLWNPRNRITKLIILATSGLILNWCCCIVIPLSSGASSLAAQSNVGANAISTPAFTAAQDPFIPRASSASARTEFDNNGDGRVSCKNFNSQAAVRESAAHIQLDGSEKDSRSCKSLP